MQITKPNRVTRSCTQRLVALFTEEHYEQFMHAWRGVPGKPGMKGLLRVILFCCCAAQASADVLHFAELNTRQMQRLDRNRTVLIIPGGILEEHGPYLPAGPDGIFNQRLADDLALAVAAQPGWNAVLLPSVPLGAGAANEIGRKYSFPGSATVMPQTLRAIFMDLGDQLGKQGFRWIFVVHGHGDPAHNRMLDDAGDYFHDTYGGVMLNVFGYLWAMESRDFRTPEQRAADGLAEHATMTETSVILALKPDAVAPDFRSAPPQTGGSMEALQQIATGKSWPGYFGAPALATPELGRKIYGLWLERARELVLGVLNGKPVAGLPRYGTLYADDPADAAAAVVNAEMESQHQAWLAKRGAPTPAAGDASILP